MSRHVYAFDAALPARDPKELLGGKGAGLNAMTELGIPVPPGFTITTDVCLAWRARGDFPEGFATELKLALEGVELRAGRRFGDAADPLLVSVRSGARVSMPGMMDTILNLGLNAETVEGLAATSGDRRFAFDAYRRLVQMYGDVVLGVDHHRFEETLGALKKELGDPRVLDSKLPAEALEELVRRYLAILEGEGKPFPSDVQAQLHGAIGAVFASWDNTRAVRYRKMQGIPHEWGTACTVQAMVFGNLGETSGSGVAFTRNPSTGQRALYGEYLANAQGEDVVAGIKLERHFGDMQDIEFTVEQGRTYILQTRSGKRTAHAAVRIAVELVHEGVLTKEEALGRVDATSLEQLLHARLPTPDELLVRGIRAVATGLPASPGAAVGAIVFDADEAERLASEGRDVLLVRRETSPEDIHGMKAARGIVTATGGMTSHAAVVARGLGKCCVAGCAALNVDYAKQTLTVRTEIGEVRTFQKGDVLSLDGSYGKVYAGPLDVVAAAKVPELEELMRWADETRELRVRANADTPADARRARSFGAEGIGLCRTEHMFFVEERLEAMRCVALAGDEDVRAEWLGKIEPMLREDFAAMLEAMDGLPVTIRLLDWPLHEFLPREPNEHAKVARALGVPVSVVEQRARQMHEINPMLGHRAVRVGLTAPSIYRMMVRAILDAAIDRLEAGGDPRPEIMIPVVGIAGELSRMKQLTFEEAERVFEARGRRVEFKYGTMIELPRACLVAGELAKSAEFFSFGTNDLTQTVFGISRDDAGRFLPVYVDELQLLPVDPFVTIDEDGVGAMIRMACERGVAERADLSLGLCGEHGGDPQSILFAARTGLSYVSCSPPRLPVARLAAAQARTKLRAS
ncbi:MAG: pyruvate, phosphate dikinase [Myxococcota bacterium]|nr:pyruvate, phosphate dikinase [Myxococcota bacterium]